MKFSCLAIEILEDKDITEISGADSLYEADGIIKSGELIYSLYANGLSPVWRDSGHVSYGIGRLAVGLLWYKTLTGNSVLNNTFKILNMLLYK